MDTQQIVTLSAGGRPVLVRNLEDQVTFTRVRGSFSYQPGEREQQLSGPGSRFGGEQATSERVRNGSVQWQVLVNAATADLCEQAAEAYVADVAAAARGRFMLWRLDGTTLDNLFEIAGPGSFTLDYQWVEFAGARVLRMNVQFPVLPLVRGLPMRISDPFDVDSLADYVFESGTGMVSVAGGELIESSSGEKRFYHSARGYKMADAQVTVKFTTGASVTNGGIGVLLRRTGTNTYLIGRLAGGYSSLTISKVVGGVFTTLNSAAGATAVNTTNWIRFRTEGNVLTVELWTSPPTPAGAPSVTVTHTLAGADVAAFGAGVVGEAGIRWTPNTVANDEKLDDFTVEPYTRRALVLPDSMPLPGIPGTAPALCEIAVTHSGGANAPVFAHLAATARPPVHNYCWNGHFETDTNGWAVATVTNIHAAATSITRVTAAGTPKFGVAAGEIVCPATADSGASFIIRRRFRKSVTYTASLWARQSAGTANSGRVEIGNSTGNDKAASGNVALTSSHQLLTVTWTPTADRDEAHVAFTQLNATTGTYQIDGVQVYEGTTAPTRPSQVEGRGGDPPFGVIEAERASSLTNWTINADVNARGGQRIIDASVSGAETYQAIWPIDPALLDPDDFVDGQVTVEVWARMIVDGALVSPIVAVGIRDQGALSATVWTSEHGQAGKLLRMPVATGAIYRPHRLGTIIMPTNRDSNQRAELVLNASTAAGSGGAFGIDYLWLAPARASAATPTNKPPGVTYPSFLPSTAELTKVVRSDLSATIAAPNMTGWPDHGLGSTLLELPAGDSELLIKLSSQVPDDPAPVAAVNEQLSHTATVSVDVTPRWHMLRGA